MKVNGYLLDLLFLMTWRILGKFLCTLWIAKIIYHVTEFDGVLITVNNRLNVFVR